MKVTAQDGIAIGTYVLTLAVVANFWNAPFTALGLIACVHAILLYMHRHTEYVVAYIAGFFLGPASEIVAIAYGAWQYTEPFMFGIPIWLPLVWGGAGVFFLHITHLFESWYAKGNRRGR